ncbi:MAG: ParB/RepB/Spo0J family partition protein [Spirulina sp.]
MTASAKVRQPRAKKPAESKKPRRVGARYFKVKGIEIYQQLKTKQHSDVFPNPDQPRKHFDREALAELAGSIRENNLLQPITITPNGMIIAGERRWRACALAELVEVACLETGCVDGSPVPDSIIMALAMLENLARKDMTPMEEALGYQYMLDEGYFADKKELAKFLGKEVFRINERLALLQLCPDAQEAFNRGDLTKLQAFYMTQVVPERQQKLWDMIRTGKIDNSHDRLKRAVAVLNAPEVEQAGFGFDIEDPTVVKRWLKLEGQVKSAGQAITAITMTPGQLEELTEGRCDQILSLLEGVMEAVNLLKQQVSDQQIRHLAQ